MTCWPLPVLDGEERMVGIVTVDDAMDVLTEAAAEDLSIMAAVTPGREALLRRLRLGATPAIG